MQMEQLQKDMIAAMKAKDKPRKEAISSLVSAVKKAAIDAGCRDDIKEDMVDQVILKELKTVKEQIDTCPAEREDLKAEYQFRYDVIQEYAPSLMSEEEIRNFIMEKFADIVAQKNKGMIMKNVMPELKGKADGKLINQVVAIVGILAATAIMIYLAALYGNRNRFDYLKDLDKTVFTLDGTDYQLRDMTYYIARQEKEIEKQAMVYDPDDTNAYWGLHTNGKFVRLEAKRAVLDRVVHDMMFYEAAKKEGMELDEKEKQYARDSASDLCYDLSDEQKERAGLTDEEIYEMTDKAALAEKYQKVLADKEGENFGAYDYNGKAYEKMLEEHKLKVKKKFWDKVPFGNVTLNHKFEDQEDES